ATPEPTATPTDPATASPTLQPDTQTPPPSGTAEPTPTPIGAPGALPPTGGRPADPEISWLITLGAMLMVITAHTAWRFARRA
ncbi:MAG TPA: hypothetical protein VIT93_07350, partial [Dehalococcoidia bacterium]